MFPEDGYKKLSKDVGCTCGQVKFIVKFLIIKLTYIFTKIEENEIGWACGTYG